MIDTFAPETAVAFSVSVFCAKSFCCIIAHKAYAAGWPVAAGSLHCRFPGDEGSPWGGELGASHAGWHHLHLLGQRQSLCRCFSWLSLGATILECIFCILSLFIWGSVGEHTPLYSRLTPGVQRTIRDARDLARVSHV